MERRATDQVPHLPVFAHLCELHTAERSGVHAVRLPKNTEGSGEKRERREKEDKKRPSTDAMKFPVRWLLRRWPHLWARAEVLWILRDLPHFHRTFRGNPAVRVVGPHRNAAPIKEDETSRWRHEGQKRKALQPLFRMLKQTPSLWRLSLRRHPRCWRQSRCEA